MTPIREAFNERQIELLLKALRERQNRLRANARNTIASGYGRGTTLDKAQAMNDEAEEYGELESYIAGEYL